MISRDQDDGRVIGHFDQHINPQVSFPNGGLVGCEVAVDHKEVSVRLDGICNKLSQALGGVGEVAVFIEMKITGVTEA